MFLSFRWGKEAQESRQSHYHCVAQKLHQTRRVILSENDKNTQARSSTARCIAHKLLSWKQWRQCCTNISR